MTSCSEVSCGDPAWNRYCESSVAISWKSQRRSSRFKHEGIFLSGEPSLSVSEHKVNPKYVALAMRVKYDHKDYIKNSDRDYYGKFCKAN